MKKLYLYIIIGIVVVGTAGYFLLANSDSRDMKYRTEKVSRGNIVVQVRATGTINPVQTVQVGSQVSGIIQKIYVDFNSEVKKGQVIAQIDSTFLNASVKEVEANRERSQAQVSNAERTLSRTSELFKKNLVAQADLDAATTAYESAVAELKQTEASLDRVKVNLRYALIRAPIDGVVISRDVDVGQTVAASFQTPNLFKIANDLKHMQVQASVDEADIGQVHAGEEVTFSVDAYPDEQFRGSVSQVRLSPITVQNVVTYTVIIDVPNRDMKLRPGMTATVSILIDKREDVLRVPSVAMQFQPPQEMLASLGEEKPAGGLDSTRMQRRGQQWAQRGEGQGQQWRPRDAQGQPSWRRFGDDERGAAPHRKMVRLWILEHGKSLKSVTEFAGISDNRYTEISGGELKEGDEVVIGSMTSGTASSPMQQTNPFQTRMPGGGGRGRF